MTQSGQRMLHSDAFAWYMEKDPVLRSTVVAIARLETSPDWERLRARIDRLTRLVPRLRMRVQVPPLRVGPPRWTVDETFDLDFHVRRMRVGAPGEWTDVLEFARTVAMDDFDRSRPLWEFTLLDGMADGGAALVTKLHHSLTDGIGGMQLAALVVDPGPDEPPLGPLPEPPTGTGVSAVELTARTLAGDLGEAVAAARRATGSIPAVTAAAVRNPVSAARAVVTTSRSIARFVMPVNRQISGTLQARQTRRLLCTLDVPLERLHASANAAGSHVNDAFLAALVDAVRRYHVHHGEELSELRVTVPISIRHTDDEVGGNRITLARIKLPASIGDPAARIAQIGAVMRRWRHEPALNHTQEIAFGLNLLPRAYLGGIFKRIELLASDVPGLPHEVWIAGARLTGYYPFGPTIGSAVNATLMSYAGTCNIGVNIDTNAIADPHLMVSCLQHAFDEILAGAEPATDPVVGAPASAETSPATRRAGEGHRSRR